MSGAIARDPSAATQLVYPWPLPIGPEHEIACADDEQAVVCPAWTIGESFGAGRRLWRSPDPSKPTSIYFVLTSSVEVPFDAISSFLVPTTQQGITLRATGTVAVRCREPAMLIAQFVGLPFDDLDGGIKRSVARSVERMLARLLTRRVVITGNPQSIVDPAVVPQICEELTLYNPTAGAVFGVELVRIVDLEIGVHDGVHSWSSRTPPPMPPAPTMSSRAAIQVPPSRPTPPRRGKAETQQGYVGESGFPIAADAARGIMGAVTGEQGERIHETSARHRTLQGAAARLATDQDAVTVPRLGPDLRASGPSFVTSMGPAVAIRTPSQATISRDDDVLRPSDTELEQMPMLASDDLVELTTNDDMRLSAGGPHGGFGSATAGPMTGAFDTAAAHGFHPTSALPATAATLQDMPALPLLPPPPIAQAAFAIGAGAIGVAAIGVSDEEEPVVPTFLIGQAVMVAEENGRLQSAVVRQQTNDFYEVQIGSTGALLWLPAARLMAE